MKKGQLSFDFIFALLLVTLICQLVIGFAGQFRSVQDQITIRLRQKEIALEIAGLIDYRNALDPAASARIKYRIPTIAVTGQKALGCDVKVEGTKITLTVDNSHFGYDILPEPVSTEITLAKSAGAARLYHCGEYFG